VEVETLEFLFGALVEGGKACLGVARTVEDEQDFESPDQLGVRPVVLLLFS
jgi:hypothetical protein